MLFEKIFGLKVDPLSRKMIKEIDKEIEAMEIDLESNNISLEDVVCINKLDKTSSAISREVDVLIKSIELKKYIEKYPKAIYL